MGDALYTRDGDAWVPGELTRGPWDPRAQHGGAPAALLARAIEQIEAPVPMTLARVAIDFLSPVPLAPLALRTELARAGRRVQHVDATLSAAERVVCRARALRVRSDPGAVAEPVEGDAPPAGPQGGAPIDFPWAGASPSFAIDGVQMSFVVGSFAEPGPVTVWIRLRVPVLDGEAPSPASRALAAADFGNGVSAVLDWERHSFINPDLTVYLDRPPEGEWICLRAQTRISRHGTGLAESALYDARGRVGRAVQALIVGAR